MGSEISTAGADFLLEPEPYSHRMVLRQGGQSRDCYQASKYLKKSDVSMAVTYRRTTLYVSFRISSHVCYLSTEALCIPFTADSSFVRGSVKKKKERL